MARVYRYHAPVRDPEVWETAPTLLRKRRRKISREAYLLAADHSTITDAAGTRPIEEYQDLQVSSAVTLTQREADLIALANPGMRPPNALEDIHPWLPHRSFVPDSKIGYRSLHQVLEKYGTHLVTASAFCDMKWNTVCNALRRKTAWDSRFFSAWHLPIQDVFVLEETRPGRAVIALDVNAMYSACMQQPIPHPASLSYVELHRPHRTGQTLAVGLYRCRLSSPTTGFIRRHNPFTVFYNGKRLRAPVNEEIEVDLNEFEIAYFERHFTNIFLVDGVVSHKVVPHPLAKQARRSFSCRTNFRYQGNKALSGREKFLATLLSSCASRPGETTAVFPSHRMAMNHLARTLGISPPDDEPRSAVESWISRHKTVIAREASRGTSVTAVNLDDGSACHMLGQRIVARGRIHLLELMEKVLAFGPNVEICYVNIDSIHFSLPAEGLEEVLSYLRDEASDDMGGFKIEAVAHNGLWLEPGRYWLYNEQIEKFRNRSIGDGRNPFKDTSYHVTSRKVGDLHLPIRTVVRMNKSMSNIRWLSTEADGLVRQHLIPIGTRTTFAEYLEMIDSRGRGSTLERLEAFQALRRRMERSCPAASGQDLVPSM